MEQTLPAIDKLCIDTIRTLAMDAVQKANSGHPGTPMALAPVAYGLWQHWLNYDPQNPLWMNRDRFVLSVGHASMLLYSLLHLTGVRAVDPQSRVLDTPSLTLEDLKNFRQLDSKTPGHPEYRMTTGVECTTGPLGQGVANSVGMAIAREWLAQTYNRPGFEVFNYDVYALCGDGDMMEGISGEAASLAGHQKLSHLCWIYDSNRITIEGSTDLAFSEDVETRFRGYHWNVLHVTDANDLGQLDAALRAFKSTIDRPTLIIVNSQIGFGAPHKQGTKEAHGEPLGAEEVKLAKKSYGWPEDSNFLVPEGVRTHFDQGIGRRGHAAQTAWVKMFADYQSQFPEPADQIEHIRSHQLPKNWDNNLPVFPADAKGVAGRDASAKMINVLAQNIPWLMGGAADLAPSTKTRLTFEGAGDFQAGNRGGRNMHFGIREHSMSAILNGMALSDLRPYGAGFFIFSDYAKPSIRLAAIMELPVIFIFTHDSIGVGEDGPTHQPIEQLPSLRAVPGLTLLRPGDANEVAEAWKIILQMHHRPAALLLSRQPLPTLDRTQYAAASNTARGAYILADPKGGAPEVILIATGSELSITVEAYEKLSSEGIKARVVSMPSWDLFEKQTPEYRESVFPPNVTARVSVEAASTFGWTRYVGTRGHSIGMSSFGASAPLKDVLSKFGFSATAVAEAARQQLGRG